ncbi:hypothetical protein FQ186_27110 [Pseudomonas sp. ANT_H14]|uniref:contact-dependent growth inhibition system immunity protein n=1 Tax=unclassified Pseudomonas TaxID=196821 RepID=UPI0011EFAB52|nr:MULTISPECIES: contact-dependent growth inhibition system immunity protein [unclassified Pseudomonas]KAA0941716.1 hypothetical protein FQ182_28690 [Pseudomonas sp. ANT_H4]KAA0946448.1 hypothetical protein FQ186_27110 [Pseudomonas sp. ANT_H14]
MNKDYSQLQQLLAGYFDEDWIDDHDNADDVIFSFISECSTDTFKNAHHELKALLLTNKTEQELQYLLFTEIGCGYYYPHEWKSGKLWLEHVDALLRQRTE